MANSVLTESTVRPEPIRGDSGASVLGPRNVPLEAENPDLFLVLRFCRVVGADPAKIIPLDCDPMK